LQFEEFCAGRSVQRDRVPEDTSKTPDYLLNIDGQVIVVDVKEITRNEEEQESDRLRGERGYSEVIGNTPGDRVRKKINDSSAQIKARSQGTYPSHLVLCDIALGVGQVARHLDPYNIRVGMYGLEQIHIAIPRDPADGLRIAGTTFGPKRKMTDSHNTSISAIGVLCTPSANDIRLIVYHNRFAAIPLRLSLLSGFGVPQFRLADDADVTAADWVDAVSADT